MPKSIDPKSTKSDNLQGAVNAARPFGADYAILGSDGASLQNGPFLPLGHSRVPPAVPQLFGPPRFTEEEQAANPNSPMTRLVKDVLPVGRWKFGRDPETGKTVFGQVSPEFLRVLADQVSLAQSRGVSFNLGKSHGDFARGIIPTDELIAPIDQVATDGRVLWMSCYVTPEQAAFLSNPACKVSPGIKWDWVDGEGNVYPIQLIHVAVTDNPVVTGQGAFVALANHDSQGAPEMNFEDLVKQIDSLLKLAGAGPLPDSVTPETLNVALAASVSAISKKPGTDPEDPADGDTAAKGGTNMSGTATTLPALNPEDGTQIPVNLSNTTPADPKAPPAKDAALSNTDTTPAKTPDADPQQVKAVATIAELLAGMQKSQAELLNKVAVLSNAMEALQTEKADSAKVAFTKKLEDLAAGGHITAGMVDNFKKIGELSGWSMSNLDGFESLKAVDMGRKSKSLATGAAPDVTGVDNPLSEEDLQKNVALLLKS